MTLRTDDPALQGAFAYLGDLANQITMAQERVRAEALGVPVDAEKHASFDERGQQFLQDALAAGPGVAARLLEQAEAAAAEEAVRSRAAYEDQVEQEARDRLAEQRRQTEHEALVQEAMARLEAEGAGG